MPCSRENIEAIKAAFDRYGSDYFGVDAAISAALTACDESQCVYDHKFGYAATSCGSRIPSMAWNDSFKFCPFCGGRLMPLPAAPEVPHA